MKLFYRQPEPDAKKIYEVAKKGTGIEHPERVNGYEGAFLFHIPDVYLSNEIARRAAQTTSAGEALMQMISRFCRNDYGFVTDSEWLENTETRYLSGSSKWMIGRYAAEATGPVVLETLHDMTVLYDPEEDLTAVFQQQYDKYCQKSGVTGGSHDKRRNNELPYVKQ